MKCDVHIPSIEWMPGNETINSFLITIDHLSFHTSGSILAVLNDPSFEHSEPSWVRRSIRVSHSTGVRPSLPLSTEEVDMGGIEIVTEFVSEENKEELRKVCVCIHVEEWVGHSPPLHSPSPSGRVRTTASAATWTRGQLVENSGGGDGLCSPTELSSAMRTTV